MNRNHILFSAVLLFGVGLWAQEAKTYKETFKVAEDAVLEINTTHTAIEFDTWNKNQVEIVATVTLEDATPEEAKDYFVKAPFSIVGNSKKIEVNSVNENSWNFVFEDMKNLEFDVEPFFMDLEIPGLPELVDIQDLPPMPPMPAMSFDNFDYDKYEKEGNKYLEEWGKSFADEFNEDYQKKMEEWGKKAEERAKAWEERNAKRIEARAKRMEERAKVMEKRAEKMEERAEARAKMLSERNKLMVEKRKIKSGKEDSHSFFYSDDSYNEPSIFYFSTDGKPKKYRVKKTIKIKMPKSVKLKMDIKHGEVKLASSTKNLNASLRHASLFASTIEGEQTNINVSYSPVIVQNWDFGQLKADYSEQITLKDVGELRLQAVSSDVVVDNLRTTLFATNNLGKIAINKVAPSFSVIDVSVKNGEMFCKVPQSATSLYLNGTKSKITYPSDLVMERTKNFDKVIYKGYSKKKGSDKTINVNSKYSDVTLEN